MIGKNAEDVWQRGFRHARGARAITMADAENCHCPTEVLTRKTDWPELRLQLAIRKLMEMENRSSTSIPLVPRRADEPIPLTAMQARLWEYKEREGSMRRCTTSVRLVGPLNMVLLADCVDAVVRRHESLRTRFERRNGTPVQAVKDAMECPLKMVELPSVGAAGVQQELRTRIDAFVRQAVDLKVGPLFAVCVFEVSQQEHVMVCALDHLISDGTSLGILDQEIWTLYRRGENGESLSLPPLPVQFGDYAIWQQKTYDAWLRAHEPYWRQRLTGASPLRLAKGAALATNKGEPGVLVKVSLGSELSSRLRALATKERTLLSLLVCTLHAAAMLRWSKQDDAVLLFVSNARYRRELHTMVGFVANLLHLRVEIQRRDTYLDLLRRIKREFFVALSHEDFDRVPDLMSEWVFGATDLFFNWLPPFAGEGHLPLAPGLGKGSQLRLESFPYRATWEAAFMPLFTEIKGEITVIINHIPRLYSRDTVERFVANLKKFSEEFVRDPLGEISDYS